MPNALRAALDAPVDVVVQPAANRRKKLFLADMDSTMIGQECIDELADYAGLKAHVAAITERAMRGEIAFEPALRERVACSKACRSRWSTRSCANASRLTPGGRARSSRTMRAHGAHTCLVSGGFTLFTDRVAAMIGFDETAPTRSPLSTATSSPARSPSRSSAATASAPRCIELRQEFGLAKEETMAIGDGANDLDMIVEAGLGVAYHAKPKVAAAAAARIDHGDLTALLYVQGYGREEFVQT